MKIRSLITGVLVGGLIGSATVLFTTPTSGREVRTSLKNGTKEWGSLVKDVQNKASNVKTDVLKLVSEGKKAAGIVQNQMKPSIQQWKNSLDPQMEEFRKEMEEIQKQFQHLEQSIYQK
ncbi:hypothetical protein GCM10008967_00700 [Bacillus carboniphilus]|uniref:YtxH domain-containing protein n=1 Tax=Bacillus carboniphilus TaxID=86663 RepID=A0ABN0VPJ5_9BACI